MSSWGGLHYFVSADVLLLFDKDIAADTLKGLPGKPQQKIIKDDDGQLLTVTSYPNVALLLSTLKATGNHVHVFSSWKAKYLHQVVTRFGWQGFVTDTRTLHPPPDENEKWTLSAMDCDAAWYSSSVVLVPSVEEWSPLMRPMLIHVDHTETIASLRECGQAKACEYVPRNLYAPRSMELLHALCRCVTLAEWRVRVPGTTVAASHALSVANVFACCRFYIPPSLFTTRIALLLASHGATVTENETDATHVVFETSSEQERQREADRGNASESEEEEEDSTDTESASSDSSSTYSSSQGSSSTDPPEATAPSSSPAVASGVSAPFSPEAPPPPRRLKLRIPQETPTSGNPQSDPKSIPRQVNEETPTPIPANRGVALPTTCNPRAQLVSRPWIESCCRALRLLPVPPPLDVMLPTSPDSSAELLRTTGTLLTALLPPVDARPLPFQQFEYICKAYHFPISPIAGASVGEAYGRLTALFKGVAIPRQVVVPPKKQTNQESGAGTARALDSSSVSIPSTLIVMSRQERKRERDAVGEHLRLQASQFAVSFGAATQALRAARFMDAGTQTQNPRYVHAGVNTDSNSSTQPSPGESHAVGASSVSEVAPDRKPDVSTITVNTEGVRRDMHIGRLGNTSNTANSQSSSSPTIEQDKVDRTEPASGTDEEEWKSHLKNAEGKLLRSTPTRETDNTHQDSDRAGVRSGEAPVGGLPSRASPAAQQSHGDGSGGSPQPSTHDTPGTSSAWTATSSSIFSVPPTMQGDSIFKAPPATLATRSPTRVQPHAPPPPAPAPPVPLPITESIFPMPDLSFLATDTYPGTGSPVFTPFTPLRISGAGGTGAAVAVAPNEHNACSILVSALSGPQRRDFFQYLQLMPMFSGFTSSTRVEEDFAHDRVTCVFDTEKEMRDFRKLDFIDFGGMEHPIVPWGGTSSGSASHASRAKHAGASLSSMRHYQISTEEASSIYASFNSSPTETWRPAPTDAPTASPERAAPAPSVPPVDRGEVTAATPQTQQPKDAPPPPPTPAANAKPKGTSRRSVSPTPPVKSVPKVSTAAPPPPPPSRKPPVPPRPSRSSGATVRDSERPTSSHGSRPRESREPSSVSEHHSRDGQRTRRSRSRSDERSRRGAHSHSDHERKRNREDREDRDDSRDRHRHSYHRHDRRGGSSRR